MRYDVKIRFSEHILEDSLGQLICIEVPLARDGDYEYTSDEVFGDGKYNTITLHRDWEDVRKLKPQLEGKPFIVTHIGGIDLNIDNLKDHKVGHAQNIQEKQMMYQGKEYNVLVGDIIIDDSEIIEKVKSGELRGISLGYFYDVDDANPNYLKQVNMRAEHIALVPEGRAGLSKILDQAGLYRVGAVNKNQLQFIGFKETVEPHEEQIYTEFDLGYFVKYSPVSLSAVGLVDANDIPKLPEEVIKAIAAEDVTDTLVLFGEDLTVVKAFERGLEVPLKTIKGSYRKLVLGKPNDEFDSDYEIPDDRESINRENRAELDYLKEERAERNAYITLSKQLKPVLRKVEDEYDRGHGTGGRNWNEMLSLIFNNKDLLNAEDLKTPEFDNRWIDLARQLVNRGEVELKKAGDEAYYPFAVATFNKDKVELNYANNLDDVYKLIKKYKIKLDKKELDDFELSNWNMDDELRYINKANGIFVVDITEARSDFGDEEPNLLLVEVVDEDNVSVILLEGLSEVNKELSEYFKSVGDAEITVNTRFGKYSKMAAMII